MSYNIDSKKQLVSGIPYTYYHIDSKKRTNLRKNEYKSGFYLFYEFCLYKEIDWTAHKLLLVYSYLWIRMRLEETSYTRLYAAPLSTK